MQVRVIRLFRGFIELGEHKYVSFTIMIILLTVKVMYVFEYILSNLKVLKKKNKVFLPMQVA